MSTSEPSLDRRRFIAGVTLAGAAVGLSPSADAQVAAPAAIPAARGGLVPILTAAAENAAEPSDIEGLTTTLKAGADFMVDAFKSLGIKYIASNCGSSFRGLQESFLDYGNNTMPEWLTCMHEESATALAHGYYKVAGKPMLSIVHAVVGLQHASMAIYNAFVDRAGVIVVAGNSYDANTRRPGVEWVHSADDQGVIVRDYTKWDDQPASLQATGESIVRAYEIATAMPAAPVLLSLDSGLMEQSIQKSDEAQLMLPKVTVDVPPQGDVNALREVARLLVAAESPVIIADRYARDDDGPGLLVKLAELVQAPVVDLFSRLNMPNQHWLQQSGRRGALVRNADFILALEPVDLWGVTHSFRDQLVRSWQSITKPDVKIATIGLHDLLTKGDIQDLQRYYAADISIAGDAQSSLPSLIEAVQNELTPDRTSQLAARGQKLQTAWQSMRQQYLVNAAAGWDLTPISIGRVSMELWDLIKDDDWGFGGEGLGVEQQLWTLEQRHHYSGGSGGSGVGYNLPASVGAALANRDEGRYTVAFQRDGDSMYAPGVMWTAAHHRIPLLSIVHNNRAWHQEVMHIQRVAYRHGRGADRWRTGTTITDPYIDFAMLAKGMGMYSDGPITSTADLRPALQRALAVVKGGEPALVDVIMQPR